MPLPFTTVATTGITNGWSHTGNVGITFTSNQATYADNGSNPAVNNFKAALPYSLTYGITKAPTPVPDTTYPVPGDMTNYNSGVNAGLAAPICPSGNTIPSTFATNASLTETEGIYNVHYFTTDCAFTEELLFNPTGTQLSDPTANWATFPVLPFGVDLTLPVVSNVSTLPSPIYLNQPSVALTFTCTDDTQPGSGLHTCDTSLSNNVPVISPNPNPVPVGPGSFNGSYTIPTNVPVPAAQNKTVTITAQDFAGNTATTTTPAYSVLYETSATTCGAAGDSERQPGSRWTSGEYNRGQSGAHQEGAQHSNQVPRVRLQGCFDWSAHSASHLED